ncbi:MAG: hypothetical protein EA367_19160 [Leptolyngbya sp. DLM2.Bin15]|nr:MAG: hypothetical protein EA367_19160 [Leptolyngbya sp. DLM2.Bin15]
MDIQADLIQVGGLNEMKLPGFDYAQPSSYKNLSMERHSNACPSLCPLTYHLTTYFQMLDING